MKFSLFNLQDVFPVIKIEAEDIGLSQIHIKQYDYIHQENGTIDIINHLCTKCENNKPKWKLADSAWTKINGIWYKKINGQYKRKVNGQWVLKDD